MPRVSSLPGDTFPQRSGCNGTRQWDSPRTHIPQLSAFPLTVAYTSPNYQFVSRSHLLKTKGTFDQNRHKHFSSPGGTVVTRTDTLTFCWHHSLSKAWLEGPGSWESGLCYPWQKSQPPETRTSSWTVLWTSSQGPGFKKQMALLRALTWRWASF